MIKLMLMAGSNSQKLADFLCKRGTFDVTNMYPSLKDSLNDIQTKVIRVDKFLYLYNPSSQDEGFDIRADMRVLDGLLRDTSFFTPGEVIFMLRASEESAIAMKYFKTVMQNTGYTNYSIKQIEGQLSYEAIYNSIMGVSTVRDFDNTYRDLYKVEKNSEADLAYAAKDDRKLKIEPFSFTGIETYEGYKDTAVKTDSGQVFTDSADTVLNTVDNPKLSTIELKSQLADRKVAIVTGKSKSGKSVWSTVLSTSAVAAGKTTAVFDFTLNSDMDAHFRMSDVVYKKFSLKQALNLESVEGGSLTLFFVQNKYEDRVKVDFLSHALSVVNSMFDVVIIVCELDLLDQISELLSDSITNVLLTSTALVSDLTCLVATAEKFRERNLKIILNESINLLGIDGFCSSDSARAIFPEPYVLIKPKQFTKLNFGPNIYKSVIGD